MSRPAISPKSRPTAGAGRGIAIACIAAWAPLATAVAQTRDDMTGVPNAVMPAPAAPAATGPLRIVSFDLRQAPSLASEVAAEPQKPSWRTSFGSEVRAETKSSIPTLDIDADVVLLQGLTSMRAVRRLFPARGWKLVVSRQLLSKEDALDPWSRDSAAAVPTTAVAVRFQRDVRVTGQDHLMELAHRELASKPKAPAGTAVRISARGKSMWLVSVGLTAECLADRVKCTGIGLLERWRRARVAEGEPTYVGGAIAVEISRQPCSGQAIVGDDLDKEATVVEPGSSERHAVVGCLARYEIAR